MSILKLATAVSLAAFTSIALHGERHCPGDVASVPLRVVQGALIVAPVIINGRGPFDFIVDSGAQITTIDSQLAVQLELQAEGATGVAGVATFGRRSFTHLAEAEIGSHRVENLLAVIDVLGQLHQADAKMRGIVGENYLAHFDLLIDNGHRMLCLDETGVMAAEMKGPHVTLEQPYGPDHDLPFTRPLVISVRLLGIRKMAVLFRLDSGSNAPVIYGQRGQEQNVPENARILKRAVEGVEQEFAVLPPQDLAIGSQRVRHVTFVQPMESVGIGNISREDGLLPTALFQELFVSYHGRFAILDPR